MASLYMTLSDIATVIDVLPEELRRDVKNRLSEVGRAYARGKVASKLKLRKQEMALAQVGSPLALENSRRALIDMEEDE